MKTNKSKQVSNMGMVWLGAMVILGAAAAMMQLSGCGAGGGVSGTSGSSHMLGGGATVTTEGARVTGMVILRTTYSTLARSAGEDSAKTAPRTAAQSSVVDCGAVPAGWVVVPDATITVSGESGSAVTDSNGCFSFDIQNMGTKIFTATKTNAKGGTTILKKAADVQPGVEVRFTENESIQIVSTVAALLIEEKLNLGEINIDCDAMENYVISIQDQDDVQSLMNAIAAAADPDDTSVTSFDDIDISTLNSGALAAEAPVIFNASVSGSPVASTGGDVSLAATVKVYGEGVTIETVGATLMASGIFPIQVTLTDTGDGTYTGSYALPANPYDDAVTFVVTFSATDSNDQYISYTSDSLNVIQTGSTCGNSTTEGTETCDDGNTTTEVCTYGQTSCTVCDSVCQSVPGATTYCGDETTQASDGEACDDGNTTTEVCTYGQTSCTVCDSVCQSVPGATSYCGDSSVDATNGETCDDGAETATCDSDCTAVTCGDGTTNTTAGETCDDGVDNGQPNHCNGSCNGTTPSVCGNNVVEAGEVCDDGDTVDGNGCSANCLSDETCGNNIVDTAAGEVCDDGNTTDGGGCSHDCTSDETCGNSITDIIAGESCDDGNFILETCTYGQTFCQVCNPTCHLESGATTYCGDSVVQGGEGEVCDDGNTDNTDGCLSNCRLPIYVDSGQDLGSNVTYALAAADVDGDGDIDVIEGVRNADNQVWLNDGAGVFTNSGQNLGGADDTRNISAGDVDGDGDIDYVEGIYGAPAEVWLNDGAGNFSDSGQALGTASVRIGLTDVDGDSDLDIIVGRYPGSNSVFLNNGSGVFSDSGQSLAGTSTWTSYIQPVDVDGDGDNDFIEGIINDPRADFVWINDGAGNFSNSGQTLGAWDSYAAIPFDYDNDGDLDILIGGIVGALGYMELYLNNGTGIFTDSGITTINPSDNTVAPKVYDADLDGDLDILCGVYYGENELWLNDGSGNFEDHLLDMGNSWTESVVAFDMDGDGDIDYISGNRGGDTNENIVWRNTTN